MFKKYPSLENHYREKFINQIKLLPTFTPEMPWVASEKIHGANFQFWTDGKQVKVGSRSQFVDGSFYGCQKVIDRYHDEVISLYKKMYEEMPGLEYIRLYGELFGGNFFGEKEKDVRTIQSGINYNTDIDFSLFDVACGTPNLHGIKEPEWFHSYYWMVEKIVPGTAFKVPPELGRGTLKECLALPNDDQSIVHKLYGLEAPEGKDNTMEGIVIKPLYNDLYLNSGSRAVIKSKNDKWSENQKTPKDKTPKAAFTHPLQPTIDGYINSVRLDAVLSKVGGLESLTNKDFGRILGMYAQDVVEDLIKDDVLPEDFKSNEDLKPLGSWINIQVRDFLLENVMKKI